MYKINEVVYCWECKHRGDADCCPMCIEELTQLDDGDGFMSDDWVVIDNTQDDGFCHKGERY